MRHFLLGSAFLMFIASLPADATNDHTIPVEAPFKAENVVFKVEKTAFMPVFAETLPPVGYVTFCQEHQGDCRYSGPFADLVQLAPDKVAELEQVNNFVNTTVKPVTDLELYGKVEYWTYPKDKGDCEDYVLLKRRMLIERGWPESTLLITVVRDENNEGHAVLTARTDAGDLILDNKRADIVRWTETPYAYIKQQSGSNPLVWTSLLPTNDSPQTAVSASRSH
jgi:predicted transglutaminase-like cysteine proteinase